MPKQLIPSNIAKIIILFWAGIASALPSDRDAPIELSADTMDLSQAAHRVIFQGRVHFDQGTRHIRALRAITEADKENKLAKAHALGSDKFPAHYWEKIAADKPILHAYAKEIRYYPKQHRIELIGHARVQQGEEVFAAEKIIYDTLKQAVETDSIQGSRTEIIVHRQEKQQNERITSATP